jgi:2',3'-cyclic-nucleotide 2'-phosphodiesterase/3'-nucleotidase
MPLLALLVGLAVAPQDTVRLMVVATADLGGQVTNWDYLRNTPSSGGLARATTVIDSLRERFPEQVVVVDAGGALSGNPLAAYYGRDTARDPHPVIEAMNIVGYDAATPGDRDFDFGADRFNRAIAGANFPWVSGNLRVLPADTLALQPYVVIPRRGVKVAITGFTTPGAMIWNGPRLEGHYRVDRVEAARGSLLRSMREDADFVVVLSNTGLAGSSSYDTTGIGGENVAAAFAEGPERPDLVILGHGRPPAADTVIGGTRFIQPGPDGGSIALVQVTLVRRGGRYTPVRVAARQILLQEVRPADRLLRRLTVPHNAVLRWVATPVGEARGRFSLAGARVEDTPLMQFIHEAERRATGADLAAASALDLRAGLDVGEVTRAEIFRLYPYEHALRSVRISGADLKAYLEQCARYFYVDSTGRVYTNKYYPADRYDLVGGASYLVDLSQPMGARITRLTVRGRPVQPTDTFSMALPDARQQGQGNFPMLRGAPVLFHRDVTVREALLAELARRKVLAPEDFPGRDWGLAPAWLARRARALFVRTEVPEATSDSASPAPEPVLPLAQSAAERLAEDSAERARERAEAVAQRVVATLRLPAEAGRDKGLPRLLADAYRNELRADVAIVLPAEATAPLPAGGLTEAQIAAAAAGEATLLSLTMPGRDLAELLENAVARAEPCCEFSGLQVQYDSTARAWEKVRRVRLTSTGRGIDAKRNYVVAISTRLLEGDGFSLGSTDCEPVRGCRTPGTLSRWHVTRTDRRPAAVLQDYLRALRQPVTPPDDRRLLPSR